MDDVNLLYLQALLSLNGRDSLRGRNLFDEFRRSFKEARLAHIIADDDFIDAVALPVALRDMISKNDVRESGVNVIYLEGGFFEGEGEMRLEDKKFIDFFVAEGGIMIVADADADHVEEYRDNYLSLHASFLRAKPLFPDNSRGVVYGVDDVEKYRGPWQFRCYPDRMNIADWLRPIYEDVGHIAVSLPAKIETFQDVAASGNVDTSATLHGDVLVSEKDPFPFASVHQHGEGFIVFIAADVSSDIVTSEGDNARWLVNMISFLRAQSLREAGRYVHLPASTRSLFLSHRSLDSSVVEAVSRELRVLGVRTWLDKDMMALGDSLSKSIGDGLAGMTAFVLFWSKHCVESRWVEREIAAASARMIESGIPMFVVTLDDTSVPALWGDLKRLSAKSLDAPTIAGRLESAIRAWERRQHKL
jgi:hypothetical protein